ncbi:MAG TPA: hypothetical protein VG269_18405 [Tepidisphaeraceae bacterium]|jgi:hypothetical protein|nr:hypothetical protein [Tepidisphaeraceae bacterium]
MTRLTKGRLIFLFVIGLPIVAWQLRDYIHVRKALNSPVLDGDVIARTSTYRAFGVPAGRVTIRLVGASTVVHANTNRDDLSNLPTRIRVHYTGNPAEDAFIEGTENPLGVALFVLGILGLLTLVYFKLRGKPNWEKVVG